MAKNIRKLLSVCMVLCMLIGVLPLQALAAEDGTTSEIVDGVEITTTQTTEVTTDGDKTTVTVTIEQTSEGTKESTGEKIEGTETTVTSTTTDAEGNELGNSWSVDGYEKKEWTEEITTDDTGLPEVDVALKPGETTTADATSDPVVESDENGTTTTTTIDREVTVDASDVKVTVDNVSSDMNSVEFEDYEGKKDVSSTLDSDQYLIEETEGESHDGYDHQYVGYVEAGTSGFPCVKVVYQRDDEGNLITDADGKPLIDHFEDFFNGTFKDKDGQPIRDFETLKDKYISSPTAVLFCLQKGSEEDFKNVYTYCCDLEIDPIDGMWYTVTNLEDSDYYASEESEAHIRGIVNKGYWGVSNTPDENGEFKRGSIAQIKADMKAAIENGEIENVLVETTVDENGNEVKIYLSDVIDDLTEGEALNATQAAIWSYSNGSVSVQNPKDGFIVLDPAYRQKPADAARITALYNWLMNQTAEKEVTVINEQNFVEDISLVVGDQVAEAANNTDDNKDNDVYHTAMNFKLAFVPGENDDLLVYLQYKDLDGNDVSIIKRLAGTNAGTDAYETIVPDENGNYTIKGLKLRENEDFEFDLKLQGTQYLEDGVYIYQTEGGRNASQTFVGIAEGTRTVDASMGITIKFNVDESKHVVAEHIWHEESDPVITPPTTSEEEEETPPPVNYRVVINDDGLEEIPDEPVPLASAPKTGDNSGMWLILVLVTAFGLVAINVVSKKRQHNTF